jgi:hypothetical protein
MGPGHVSFPNAIIAGAPRSGTTTLFAALRTHPDVFCPRAKELHFFDRNWENGADWYAAQFCDAGPGQIKVEATPLYLSNSQAMRRISSLCPEALLLAVLRNPVERLHSHFYYRKARGLDFGTIEQAIERELSEDPKAFPYLAIGLYAHQLSNADELGLAQPVSVHWYDDLVNDPVTFADGIAAALGIDPAGLRLEGLRVNSADKFRSVRVRRIAKVLPRVISNGIGRLNRREVTYPALTTHVRNRLVEYYRSDIGRLGTRTGRDLSHWVE